jgi:hypothetical protein
MEQEFDLVITFTTEPTEKQLGMAKDFVKGFELANPQLRGTVITPRPPRVG